MSLLVSRPPAPLLVKASAVTNLTDARYFAAKEVAFLGFNLEEGTDGYLDPMFMKAIREWVEGPRIIGEFSTAPFSVVREAAAFFGLDAVQVRVDQGDLSVLDGLDLILEIPVAPDFSPEHLENELRLGEPFAQHFLLDFTQHGLDWAFISKDIDFWERICRGFPVLLAFDFSPENLPGILEALAPAGIALRGGAEEKVGVKSFDELDEVFEVLDTGD